MKSNIRIFKTVELILRESEASFLKSVMFSKQKEMERHDPNQEIVKAFLTALEEIEE